MRQFLNIGFLQVLFISGFFSFTNTYSQTCCSGGVPLSSNLGIPIQEKKTFVLSVLSDYNSLSTLLDGSEKLPGSNRFRSTTSFLIKTGYQFSERLSGELLVPFVWQNRRIDNGSFNDVTNTNGIGDVAMLMKYLFLKRQGHDIRIQLGSGIKVPTGQSDLKRDDGITINADLQPGSGSWDFIGYGDFNVTMPFRPSMSYYSNMIMTLKGKNPRYLGNNEYQFGNEFIWIHAISDQLLIKNFITNPSLGIKYRKAGPDRQNDHVLPNTGGNWIFAIPGLQIFMTPKTAVNISGEIPVRSFSEGIQLNTTYRLKVGITFLFTKNNFVLN